MFALPGAWPLMPLRHSHRNGATDTCAGLGAWTDDLFRLFNEPAVADWLFLTGPPTREDVDGARGSRRFWRERGYGMFVATEKDTGRFVARIGAMVTPETGRVEIAWSTITEAQGKGYASRRRLKPRSTYVHALEPRRARLLPAARQHRLRPRGGEGRVRYRTRALSMIGCCGTTKCRVSEARSGLTQGPPSVGSALFSRVRSSHPPVEPIAQR